MGDMVIWIVEGFVSHIVISMDNLTNNEAIGDLLDSFMLVGGNSYSYIFDKSGIYIYCCKSHGMMTGTVIVQEVAVACFVYSNAECVDNYCGGCFADFYVNG